MPRDLEAAELERYLEAAEAAARAAGQVLRDLAGKCSVHHKGLADLVTDADFAAQECIHGMLLRQFPHHGFLGEEQKAGTTSGGRQPAEGTAGEFCWIVDPLDGTTNYVHHVPFYAVSIALAHRGQPVVGVVYDPSRDVCFRAAERLGAWRDHERLAVSAVDDLEDALIVTSFPPGIQRDDPQVEHFLRVLTRSQSLRRTGSAALNLAYVASGRFDAFWSTSLHAWDFAAGVLLVTEAGGRISDTSGSPLRLEGPCLLATNGTRLHEELSALLSRNCPDE